MKSVIELKGYIFSCGACWITCCDSNETIQIGKISLNEVLGRNDPEINEDDYGDYTAPDVAATLRLEYVILDEPPEDENITFEELSAEVITKRIYSSFIGGCYSVWTCGSGGFDYVTENGHSIFNEMSSYAGKWCWLRVVEVDINE